MGRLDHGMKRAAAKTLSARARERMDHQVDATRERILDAAERLSLDKGLEATSMVDIAAAAGITKVTLYRYFPDRHPIAFAIAGRMLRKIGEAARPSGACASSLPAFIREYLIALIKTFPRCIEAYRYLGQFDQLYADSYPEPALAERYGRELRKGIEILLHVEPETIVGSSALTAIVTTLNAINGFLQKMAGRGKLMETEQGVGIEAQLAVFESIICIAFDAKILPLLEIAT